MNRTWMLRAAGIVCIISGAIVVIPGGILVALGLSPTTKPGADPVAGALIAILVGIPSIILGTVAIVGGIHALRRKSWGLALAGAIALGSIALGSIALAGFMLLGSIALVGLGISGIVAIVFVALGKGEFRTKLLAEDISPKSRRATALLAFFLGVFGAHRFYIGRTRTAIVMLLLSIAGWAAMCMWLSESVGFLVGYGFLTAVVPVTAVGVWAFIDFIFAVTGDMTDKEGRLIKKW